MSPVLQIFMIAFVALFIAAIVRYLVMKKLNLKYTLVWLGAAVFMLIIAIFRRSSRLSRVWLAFRWNRTRCSSLLFCSCF